MPKLSSQRARTASGAVCTLAGLIIDASAAQAQLAPIWNGFYAGVQGGVTWAELDYDIGSVDARNGVWGLHAGYNLANGRFLIGLEGDVNFSGAQLTISDPLVSGSADTEWSGSLRVRAGMTFGPMLLYGTVGYAHMVADYRFNVPSIGLQQQGSETLTGLVYGLGAEGFVMPNVSLRVEALQYDYNLDDDALRPFVDPSETVVRAGLTFHLN